MNKLKIEYVEVDAIHPSPFNVNVVSPDNEQKIENSMKRLGVFKPVICRETDDGLEIIGGEHRWSVTKRSGEKTVPIINLGRISDERAKEISLVDNGRYGADDTLMLAEVLEGLNVDELASFMPYSDADIASIFSHVNIELDSLDLPEDEGVPEIPKQAAAQTHQVMRFKVPVEDVDMVTKLIERVMKTQGFTDGDSLTNAGDALVVVCKQAEM